MHWHCTYTVPASNTSSFVHVIAIWKLKLDPTSQIVKDNQKTEVSQHHNFSLRCKRWFDSQQSFLFYSFLFWKKIWVKKIIRGAVLDLIWNANFWLCCWMKKTSFCYFILPQSQSLPCPTTPPSGMLPPLIYFSETLFNSEMTENLMCYSSLPIQDLNAIFLILRWEIRCPAIRRTPDP